MQARWQTAAVLVLALILTACGGGGGGGGSSNSSGSSAGTNSPSSNPSSAPTTGDGSTLNGSTSNPSSPSTPPVSATYRVQLTWTAPGTRANGTPLPLSELAGYRVYYLLEGADPSSDSAVSVAGGSTTSLSITLSVAGTYTFAITAVDQNGLESSLSAPVSVSVN